MLGILKWSEKGRFFPSLQRKGMGERNIKKAILNQALGKVSIQAVVLKKGHGTFLLAN